MCSNQKIGLLQMAEVIKKVEKLQMKRDELLEA